MAVTVCTMRYEREYGKAPRGLGTWIFFGKNGWSFERFGMYSEAKKAAIEKAKQDKKVFITLGT